MASVPLQSKRTLVMGVLTLDLVLDVVLGLVEAFDQLLEDGDEIFGPLVPAHRQHLLTLR